MFLLSTLRQRIDPKWVTRYIFLTARVMVLLTVASGDTELDRMLIVVSGGGDIVALGVVDPDLLE